MTGTKLYNTDVDMVLCVTLVFLFGRQLMEHEYGFPTTVPSSKKKLKAKV